MDLETSIKIHTHMADVFAGKCRPDGAKENPMSEDDVMDSETFEYLLKSLERSDDYDTYTLHDMIGQSESDVMSALIELCLANPDKTGEDLEDQVNDAFNNSFREFEILGGTAFRTTVSYSTEFVTSLFRDNLGLPRR
jgi:hypothetical protein